MGAQWLGCCTLQTFHHDKSVLDSFPDFFFFVCVFCRHTPSAPSTVGTHTGSVVVGAEISFFLW